MSWLVAVGLFSPLTGVLVYYPIGGEAATPLAYVGLALTGATLLAIPMVRPRYDAINRARKALRLVTERTWRDEWDALGIGPLPESASRCLELLSTAAPSDGSAYLTALLELGRGNADGFGAVMASWTPRTPLAAARKAMIEVISTNPPGDEAGMARARSLVAAVPESDDRRVAEATLAVVEAQLAISAGRSDWWRVFGRSR